MLTKVTPAHMKRKSEDEQAHRKPAKDGLVPEAGATAFQNSSCCPGNRVRGSETTNVDISDEFAD